MGENVQKRRSMRDAEENASLYVEPNDRSDWMGKGQYPSYQDYDNVPKNHSGRSLASRNAHVSHRMNQHGELVLETEGHDRKRGFYKSMSPSSNERWRQRGSLSPDLPPSQPRRHTARERSRSRGRGEGRSRSPSRRRDRGRYQVQKRSRSRSRSRDRDRDMDRDRGNMKAGSRSGSPPHNYKGDPYGWGDRRNGSRISSSQTCRDFAIGKCRKGSECRFLHPDNLKNSDGYHLEDNMGERSGNTLEHEHDRKRNRVMVTCKDFIKGKCRWGASCKFSHTNDDYDRGVKNAPLDYVQEREPSKSSKQLCKYFVAGKCRSDNCKFSHDRSSPSFVEIRPSDNLNEYRWDGPSWDDERDSNIPQIAPNGWETNASEYGEGHYASQPQSLDGRSHIQRQSNMEEASAFDLTNTAVKPDISSNASVMPYTSEDNSKFGSNHVHSVSLSGQSYQAGESMIMGSEPSLFTSLNQSIQRNQKETASTNDTLGVEVNPHFSSALLSSLASQMKSSPTYPSLTYENISSFRDVIPSDPSSALPTLNAQPTQGQCQAPGDGVDLHASANSMMSLVNTSFLNELKPHVPLEQSNQLSAMNLGAGETKKVGDADAMCNMDPLLKQPEVFIDSEANGNGKVVANKCDDQENKRPDNVEGHGKVEEASGNKDDKANRLFKNALIEFVKEILKPTWKEGKMSREVHKTIVKKVVDKVTSTVQGDHVPKTQEKIEQYLSNSKAKLTKLVQAYVERCQKAANA